MKTVTAMSVAVLALSACALLQTERAAPNGFAPSGPNVSNDPNVSLYMSTLPGSTVAQTVAYDKHGNLLWATLASGDTVKVIAVGALAEKVFVGSTDSGQVIEGTIPCPCEPHKIYGGASQTIITISNANSQIARVIVMPASKTSAD